MRVVFRPHTMAIFFFLFTKKKKAPILFKIEGGLWVLHLSIFLITQNYLYLKKMRTKAKHTAAYVHVHS